MVTLPYTICFCLRGEQVLMVYRSNPPNAGLWNGLGGKIERDETPLINIHREMLEEAEIDLREAQELRFAGLVTWTSGADPTRPSRGMYAFLARLAPDFPTWPDRVTPEGLLSWKPLAWVCDARNPAVVNNIPHFLPQMLEASEARVTIGPPVRSLRRLKRPLSKPIWYTVRSRSGAILRSMSALTVTSRISPWIRSL